MGHILLLLLAAGAIWLLCKIDPYSPSVFEIVVWSLTALIIAGIITTTGITGGLFPNYSSGERIGYVTKASTKGIIWKTNEIQVQVGTGEMAALQEPHPFTVSDEQLFADIARHLGRRAVIEYQEWLVMPPWVGESGYEVVAIRWLDEVEVERGD